MIPWRPSLNLPAKTSILKSAPAIHALLLSALCIAACVPQLRSQPRWRPQTQSPSAANSETVAAGKAIFATTCAGCHGLDGRGGERGPDIATRAEVRRLSNADIERVIEDGSPSKKMPGFGGSLNDAKIAAIIAYVRSLQGKADTASLPGNSDDGKALFFGKAGCAECHMVDGAGGFLGNDLSVYAAGRPASEVREAIANPNKNLEQRDHAVSVVTRSGEKFTGLARNEDNFSLQLQTPDGAFHLFVKSDLERIDHLPGSPMPADYSKRLSAREMNDLVSFLLRSAQSKESHASHDSGRKKDDDN
jgi:cytochrome c oxidase cbb3-type subunit III